MTSTLKSPYKKKCCDGRLKCTSQKWLADAERALRRFAAFTRTLGVEPPEMDTLRKHGVSFPMPRSPISLCLEDN